MVSRGHQRIWQFAWVSGKRGVSSLNGHVTQCFLVLAGGLSEEQPLPITGLYGTAQSKALAGQAKPKSQALFSHRSEWLAFLCPEENTCYAYSKAHEGFPLTFLLVT